uniref:F-box/kelch-repeat protein At3g23880-like n=1 Tax=Erigeron canadensis TaxID=72917 RepID=UPI001CB8DDDF|nr:F-box/kelch-repeat protein At3g23880-like [Erigeron canadensis]
MADHLCEELTDEIFLRLPIKSLLRFRCLSKYWFSRIASPDFIRTHKLRSVNTPWKLLVKYHHWFYRGTDIYSLFSENKLSLDYRTADQSTNVAKLDLPTPIDFEIVGSCNGVFCVVDKEKKFSLWNPSIGRKLTIPVPLNYIEKGHDLALGFGVDPVTDDYKIVIISYLKTDPLVYSMKTDTWSLINSPTMMLKNVLSRRACLVNGTLYWVIKRNPNGICIMTFDLSTYVCGTVEFPEPWCDRRKLMMVVKDSLALVYRKSWNDWIWVRRHGNNNIAFRSMVFRLLIDQRVGGVLGLTDGDFLLQKYKLGLSVYNAERGKESPFPAPCYISEGIIDMETYAESLVLLDRGVVAKGNQQSCDVEAKTNGKKRRRPMSQFLDTSV